MTEHLERRDYQIRLKEQTYGAWQQGKKNVLNVLPTGGGKSHIMSDIVLDGAQFGYTQCVIAHRNELVSQMSAHIGRRAVPHRIVGSESTISLIRRQHRALFNGEQFVHPTARTSVIGVDTLIARKDDLKNWAHQHDRWMVDEAHQHMHEISDAADDDAGDARQNDECELAATQTSDKKAEARAVAIYPVESRVKHGRVPVAGLPASPE